MFRRIWTVMRPPRPQHPPAPPRHHGDRRRDRHPDHPGPRRPGRVRRRDARRSQPQARRPQHRHGPQRPPDRLKQLGRHKTYAVLDAYLELGDPLESPPLNGVL
jgi:hypothetical protein